MYVYTEQRLEYAAAQRQRGGVFAARKVDFRVAVVHGTRESQRF